MLVEHFRERVFSPPLTITRSLTKLELAFGSYESYVSSFYPTINLKIWDALYKEEVYVRHQDKLPKHFYFKIISCNHTSDYTQLECECEPTVSGRIFGPQTGMITILELAENSGISEQYIAYILDHKISSSNLQSKIWPFYAFIEKGEILFAPILMKGYNICGIENQLRLVDALHFFKDSPLLENILDPKLLYFTLTNSKLDPNKMYSSCQMEIMKGISAEINKRLLHPKVVLLNGPPGTGKTHTVIGLLEELFGAKDVTNLKVLITAPSSAAVFEIGYRFFYLLERCNWRKAINFAVIDSDNQVYFNTIPLRAKGNSEQLSQQQQSSERIEQEFQNFCLQDSDSTRVMNNRNEIVPNIDMLKKCHVVLSSLQSCSAPLMQKAFKKQSDVNFSCCIADDATHCTELEILQPLIFRVKYLILTVDVEELPATCEPIFKRYHSNRSMMNRFYSYFRKKAQLEENPISTLNEQYRMHSSICQFPSLYIYHQQLITHSSVDLSYKDFPIKPYVLLDIAQPKKSFSEPQPLDFSPQSFNSEAFIHTICTIYIADFSETSSIAIIVSDKLQCAHFKNLYSNPRYRNIEINTVEELQGLGKDIVIISAFETSNHLDKESIFTCYHNFNIAITRAKKSLIICADTDSLKKYKQWEVLRRNARERNLVFCVADPKDAYFILKRK